MARVSGPIKRVSTSELVAAEIRARIFRRELVGGERIRQEDLAQGYGVSRIPVREAFIALERDGWVTTTPNRGTLIEPFDGESILVHFEVQGLVCALAARRAAARATHDDVERLLHAQQRMLHAVSSSELHETCSAFLHTLFDVATSPRLRCALRDASSVVPGNLFDVVPGSDGVQREGAAAIADAIARHDGEAAAAAAVHLADAQSRLVIEVFTAAGSSHPQTSTSKHHGGSRHDRHSLDRESR